MNEASDQIGPVVVAHDFSDSGDEALRQANAWATRLGARLEICHALPHAIGIAPLFPQSAAAAAASALELQYRAQEALWRRSAHVLSRPENELNVNAVQGSPSAVVVQRAEELGAALVVVGPTRSGAVAQFVLGTTAEQVVRHADCDVLVARPTAASGLVMVATDLSEHAMTALARAAEEARRRDAKLVAIHCLEIAHPALASFEPSLIVDDTTLTAARDACKRTIAAQLERAGAAHGEALVVQGRSGSAIPQTAEEFGADLLVVGTHGRTGLARFALGSVASTIVRVAPCPVLVVRSGPAGPAA